MANRTYLFIREDGFYLLDLPSDATAVRNAINNPGTRRVEDPLTKETIWKEVGEPERCPKCHGEACQPDVVYSPSEWYCLACGDYYTEGHTLRLKHGGKI